MATYNANQLSGAGTPIEALTGGNEYEFTIGAPTCSGSAYFTVETVRNSSGYYGGQPTNALGLYSDFVSINQDTLITSSYISSVVVPGGGGSYKFTPTSNVAISSSFLRGTGGITLNIEEISFLLGDYPNDNGAAYSLRLLNENITNVIRVENSSGLQRDFTPEEITDGTLATFCSGGSGDGVVVTWYDQSSPSSGYDLVGGGSSTTKPRIMINEVLQTENGKPCIFCTDGAYFKRDIAWTGTDRPEDYETYSVSKLTDPASPSGKYYFDFSGANNNSLFVFGDLDITLRGKSGGITFLGGGGPPVGSQALYRTLLRFGNGELFSNTLSLVSGALLTTFIDRIYLGAQSTLGGSSTIEMKIQEFIFYDDTAGRGASIPIQENINAYYSIY